MEHNPSSPSNNRSLMARFTFGILFVVLGVFSLCITQSEGLSCYSCQHEEGAGFTQHDCKETPPAQYLHTVPDPYGPGSNSRSSVDRNYGYNRSQVSFSNAEIGRIVGGAGNTKSEYAIKYPYCMKLTGERNGRTVLLRNFAWSYQGDLNDLCQSRLPDNFQDAHNNLRGLTDIKACYCNDKDGCNGAAFLSVAITPFLMGLVSYLFK